MQQTKTGPARTTRLTEHNLPVPPKIIARVIGVAADPDSTAADLAGLISKEPTLTTQVLRAVNSAHYGLRRRIETVNHAVAFMGMSAVRNLVLCLGVQKLVRPEELGAFPLELFWECSIRRAAAAGCLARRLGLPQPEEFFTLGLCQDLGILASLRADRGFGAAYAACMSEPAAERLTVERELTEGHDTLGGKLLQRWRLPHEMTETVCFHHRVERAPQAIRGRALIARAAEAVADLLQVEEKAVALERAQAELRELQLDPDLLRTIVQEVVDDVSDAADMLQLSVGEQPGYEEIVAMASDALVSLSLTQVRDQSEDELSRQQQLTAELQQRNAELEYQAATDPLTGLANRRLLDEVLTRDMAQADRQGAMLSILLLDIDHFKRLNDTHGHLAGDIVLRAVASAVRQMVRRSDLCARFGGEEIAVVLPFTDEEGARAVAERMREAVSGLKVSWEGHELRVTVSLGGVTLHGSGFGGAAAGALRAADEALYRAKREGRNRICWYPARSR